ncbi:hypothetical protein BG015_001767 [Linnemannia schmuckeri]|uniref:Uncharacterized protein n=1 Tax=Linnemannia schmuckeri TaxID=64567 RepID=A0A9P5VDU9_9FUNG|nr:hypothetical protein BG015_001767 [Linnemannia schmuckeri]
MESAVTRFWNLPELIKMVLQYSTCQTIARLMRTNSSLYRNGPLVLYHTISSFQTWRMFSGSAGIRGLIKHAEHVRSISLAREFCLRFIVGVSSDSADASSSRGDIVFPPLPNLTSFTCELERSYGSSHSQSEATIKRDAFPTSIARALQGCPRLVSLQLGQLFIDDEKFVDSLCASISVLQMLETIDVTLLIPKVGPSDEIVAKFFFSLPQLIKTASIVVTSRYGKSDTATDGDRSSPAFPRRKEPLRKLTSLRAQFPGGFDADTVLAMIDHCPEVVTLEVPVLDRGQDEGYVAQHIVHCCPKLANLSLHFDDNCDVSTSLMTEIIKGMPEDTLQSIYVEGYHDHDTNLADSLQRHFGSLVKVEFEDTGHFDGYFLQTILHGCQVLEVLSVDGRRAECFEVPLKDVLLYRWVSKALRVLQFAVKFPNMQELDAMEIPASVSESKSKSKSGVITEAQKKGSTPLGKLYRKIQFLKNLENLQLQLSLDDREESLKFTSSGPGFLYGGEVKTGRPLSYHRFETLKELKTNPMYGWGSDSDDYASS